MIIQAPEEDPYWKLAGESYIIRNIAPIIDKNNHIIGIIGIDIDIDFPQYFTTKKKYLSFCPQPKQKGCFQQKYTSYRQRFY